jgi:hypothetical protein
MYLYQAYGLTIHSELALPELVPSTTEEIDVSIRFGRVDRSTMKVNRLGTYLNVTPQEVAFFWDGVGGMLVRDGKEVIIDPLPGVEERLLRLPILGIIFSVILHHRGFLVLHASAVEVNGGAAVFLGGRGWGKSTLAATLYGRGHRPISDDLVAIDLHSEKMPVVIPGFPQFKLLPDAAAQALGDDPDTLPRLAYGYEKRSRRVLDRFSPQPLPLRGIYQLALGPVPALKPLGVKDATIQLIGNSYIARGTHQLLKDCGGVRHLQQCATTIAHVPIYRLERPQSLDIVPAIADLVEANLHNDLHEAVDSAPCMATA